VSGHRGELSDLLDDVEKHPQRVIVGVSGSPGSLHALRRAVAEARLRDAELWAVITWVPRGGELANRRAPCPPLLKLWRDEAARILCQAWDDALGGVPDDLHVRMFALRGTAGRRLVDVADGENDLLVVGSGTSGPLARLANGSVARFCVKRARCGVLTVPPSLVERQLAHHPLARRRLLRELTQPTAVQP
jgi:nucleotide-binding universal stress UspA family protein